MHKSINVLSRISTLHYSEEDKKVKSMMNTLYIHLYCSILKGTCWADVTPTGVAVLRHLFIPKQYCQGTCHVRLVSG